jgi:hypothetical protein
VAKVHGLESISIDFVLALPQADLDVPVYMELPAGVNPVDVSDIDQCRYVLKLNKSLYGLKQAGFNWFKKLKGDLSIEILSRARSTSVSSFERNA